MPDQSQPLITVIGVGADGLPEHTLGRVRAADAVLGGGRHLAMLPDDFTTERVSWPSPLLEGLPALLERYAGRDVVALASGDPLVSGIGSTLIGLLGEAAVRVE